jgi:hypothetical protein
MAAPDSSTARPIATEAKYVFLGFFITVVVVVNIRKKLPFLTGHIFDFSQSTGHIFKRAGTYPGPQWARKAMQGCACNCRRQNGTTQMNDFQIS